MPAKTIKKGDLVKVLRDDGTYEVIRVDAVNKNKITGDRYIYERDYKRESAVSYKVKDRNIQINKSGAQKIDGQLMQANNRIRIDKDQVTPESDNEEEKIDTTRRGRKRTKRQMSAEREESKEELKVPTIDGRRSVAKKGQKIDAKTRAKYKAKSIDPDLSPEKAALEKAKEEKKRIREEKKRQRERKKLLKEIRPNENVEEIENNPFLEPINSKKDLDFPLEGCSKFSDNRIFLFEYFQGGKTKTLNKKNTKKSKSSSRQGLLGIFICAVCWL